MTNDQFRAVVADETEELKPCPFCGEKPVIHPVEGGIPRRKEFAIYCVSDNCHIRPYSTRPHHDTALLIERWNRRSLRPSDCGVRVSESAIPEGWVMVPREPTEEMERAAWNAVAAHSERHGKYQQQAAVTYKAMLAAAPPPPTTPAAPAEDHDASDYGPSVLGERKGE